MSLLTLVPLLITLAVCLSAAFYVIKKKSLAQSHCVQQAAQLQNKLKSILDKLLKLNREAQTLRTRRMAADQSLASAVASGNPYAIAAAKAVQTAVILQQTALRARQEKLLTEAASERRSGLRSLHSQLRPLQVGAIDSRTYYWRALAVEAKPAFSLSPDFVPVPSFPSFQQHRFRFRVNLAPPFSLAGEIPGLNQHTECSVSLKGKENAWHVQILAANPVSSWL